MKYLPTLALIAVFFSAFSCPAEAQPDSPSLTAPAPVPVSLTLSGAGRTVWLVDAGETTFDIMQFEAGKRWLSLTRGVAGTVRWSQGGERFLYVLTQSDQALMLIYTPLDTTPRLAPLPTEGASLTSAKLLAGWAGDGLSRGDTMAGQLGPSLLLLGLPQGEDAAPTFWMYSTAWTQFTAPEGLTLGAESQAFITVAGGKIYLLTSGDTPILWHETAPGGWSSLGTPSLNDGETVLGLLNLNDVPTLVTAALAPKSTEDLTKAETLAPGAEADVVEPTPRYLVHLRAFSAGAFAAPATVTLKEAPLTFSALPQTTQHTGRAMLLWMEGDSYRTVVCDAAGVSDEPKEVPLTSFVDPDPENVKLFEYFSYTLIGLTVLLSLTGRPKQSIGQSLPIILPPEFKPSGLLRRLAALVIDLFMWATLWYITLLKLGVPMMEMNGLTMAEQSTFLMDHIFANRQAAMATLAITAGFCLYGVVFEKAVSGTLGKLIVQIRVVGPAGKTLTWREALLRNTSKMLELIIIWLPVLFIVLNPARQRLGDVLARTLVVESSGLSLQQIEDIRERMQEMGMTPDEDDELATAPPSSFDRDNER